ncbi:branched-chain amino acid ABC transporter permease [Natrarchaeobius chitinivorans]|uniref:Branched-chain amino acid ABC transporter permease n=1 Tax=Natrarchaeobius chitinivorans TaxID=1679083 RepID=A0A3N6M8D8_NATCH|nr:branched-chain amino acid ABC transporter permease [Natrarchaeobius chitinivorans]RQG89716.1 branched-chain amino acid ABC transporter permease [Natrarchaeobius chitinivorans]
MIGVHPNYYKIAAVGIAFAIAPFVFTAMYQLRFMSIILVFALFTMGLNIAFGHTNQLFLFVGGLAGVGGYATSLLAINYDITPWVTIFAGAVIAGLIAVIVSYVAARRDMTIMLIAILTMTLQLAFIEFFGGARWLTQGTTGYQVTGLIEDPHVFYYFLIAFLLAVMLGYHFMINSRMGFAFNAIREDELAAEVVGVDVVRYKVLAGFVTGMLIGVAGALYVYLEGFILPGMFQFQRIDVLVLIMVVLGGMRTILGPVVGAAAVLVLEELVRDYGSELLETLGITAITELRLILFGSLLIVLFLYTKEGIVPWIDEQIHERDLKSRVRGLRDGS